MAISLHKIWIIHNIKWNSLPMSTKQNKNLMQQNLTLAYVTQDPTLTNHCLCTCCHKTDLLKSQCIIFKESRQNLNNTTVSVNKYSIPTAKEYICKKCDQSLVTGKMPIDAVAL